jgi:hypothetical protein
MIESQSSDGVVEPFWRGRRGEGSQAGIAWGEEEEGQVKILSKRLFTLGLCIDEFINNH